ncbi:MAG: glycosyltransferase family 2 protein [Bacteroidales bacterium]|nr:glycosyltransferase family 2 protein [Bacteroidales bacterium]
MKTFKEYSIAVVIPCYKVEEHISKVVDKIPDYVTSIILVDDASPDKTGDILDKLALSNPKIKVIHHEKNRGVGGSMITGFEEALRENNEVVIKIDGDGQMDISYFSNMLYFIFEKQYNFAKGNRFFDRKMLREMPVIRRIGNIGMGFLIKMASGYWHIFDPTNGFFCIHSSALKRIDFSRLSKRFFFESSLLIELYYTGAKIKDIAMPAIYAAEKSNLSVWKTLFTFPPKLFKAFLRRIWLRYFIYDFNIGSLYLFFGIPLFFFGLIFGIIKWFHYATLQIATPTGTIMLSVISLVLGFQMLLAAIQYDISADNPFSLENETDLKNKK